MLELKTAGTLETARPRERELTSKAVARFEVKDVDAKARTFSGLASTWEQDLGDDVIHQGAFRRTLDSWRASKRSLPLMDQHNYSSITNVLGKMTEARETADGLETSWEMLPGGKADEAILRLDARVIDGLSIGYRAVKYDWEETDAARFGRIRHLREVELLEVSLVLWPMNEGARVDLDSVKALLLKGGNLSEGQRAELEQLHEQLTRALHPEQDPPVKGTPAGGGLAPDDPRRLALEAQLRDLHLGGLARGALRTGR